MEKLRKAIRGLVEEVMSSESSAGNPGVFAVEDVFEAIDNAPFEFYDLYPGYSEPVDGEEETMFDSKEQAENHANYVIDIFKSLPNPIPIFRALSAKDESSIDIEFLGESWSMYRESAISFGSHNGSNFLISATIDKNHVNWDETLRRFVVFSFGGDQDDENEIVVEDQSEIRGVRVERLKWKNAG